MEATVGVRRTETREQTYYVEEATATGTINEARDKHGTYRDEGNH